MLATWNPVSHGISRSALVMPAFDRLFKEADGLLQGFALDHAFPSAWSVAAAYAPQAEVVETEAEIRLAVDLPGHDPKSVQVKLEGETLTVTSEREPPARMTQSTVLCAERPYGAVARSFTLPNTVDCSRCEAHFENGVLSVTLPKREDAKPKAINIQVQS
jgi:HSP20 family protein